MTSRTVESVRAEESHRELASSTRPLAKARCAVARAFDEVMHAHWLRGEESYSNVAVARSCGTDEKTVRQWRLGTKHLPVTALTLMPSQIYAEVLDIVAKSRGVVPKRALLLLTKSLDDLDGQLAHEDPTEVVKALAGAQGRIAELMKKAMGGK